MNPLMTTPQASTTAHTPPERTLRPWGWYETVTEATGHKVKRIHVHAGQRLSLQKHAQRAEHWVVVRGQARITLGNPDGETWREFDLELGQHCDIALGQVHRLASVGNAPVEIIEVQFGAYLGEDDITRLQDDFGRV
jgi:mannose-6-phosphate isomerase